MTDQKNLNNHYVPQWYQRGFFASGKSRFFHLNLDPDRKTISDGRQVPRTALHKWGSEMCFVEYDLYTTDFGPIINDGIETHLFGALDDQGSKAVRAFALGEPSEIHRSFQDFFEHMAAQKLRTPKGLDWIRSCYGRLGQVDLMVEMQALRLMHCVMWPEGVGEIVSAADSDVKLIVTDHPVTTYNERIDPTSSDCAYPLDAMVASLGTQTVFALDADTCLILTHLEYAKEPGRQDLTRLRKNARHHGMGMTRTDAFIRDRRLGRDEVIAINYLLKSRAKRCIAAANKGWALPTAALQWLVGANRQGASAQDRPLALWRGDLRRLQRRQFWLLGRARAQVQGTRVPDPQVAAHEHRGQRLLRMGQRLRLQGLLSTFASR